jgi:hypothetical protein
MKLGFCTVMMVFALSVAAGNAGAAPTAAAVENWAYNHPDAAFELWSWASENPAAARKFSEWDAMNHERSKIFVTWAISHPGKGIDAFMEDHPDWTDFEGVAGRHRSAARTLLAWCRHYPAAARALMKSSRRHRAPEGRQSSM